MSTKNVGFLKVGRTKDRAQLSESPLFAIVTFADHLFRCGLESPRAGLLWWGGPGGLGPSNLKKKQLLRGAKGGP